MSVKTTKDREWLDGFVARVRESTPILTQLEVNTIEEIQSELGNIQQSSWTSLDDDLFFPKDKVYKEGEELTIGRCVGTVQTSPERLLGWNFFFESEFRKLNHIKRNGPNPSRRTRKVTPSSGPREQRRFTPVREKRSRGCGCTPPTTE